MSDVELARVVEVMVSLGHPFCIECGTTRDLHSCDECSGQGDGLAIYCQPCFYLTHNDVIAEHDSWEEDTTNVAPDFRFPE